VRKEDFVVFIITHGRPNNVRTISALQRAGYSGRVVLLMDTEDATYPEYCKKYGAENIVLFDKLEEVKKFDVFDNFDKRASTVYARNASFRIAKELGFKYFVQLDDDYTSFMIRTPDKGYSIRHLDRMFSYLADFLEATPILSVAISQGGDHIGGYDPTEPEVKRKAMNSFICSVDRPFDFLGKLNEDVNTYIHHGKLGGVFFTIWRLQLCQMQTQKSAGGMTEAYLQNGTYIKSFYTVMTQPSSVRVATMGIHNPRMHHGINWDRSVPKIISPCHKKATT
jgi:hypothetical protein